MPLPTLLIRGNLRAPNDDLSLQEELNKYIPVEYIINWFRARLNLTGAHNRLLVLKSETASGKSTTLPPEIYRAFVRADSIAGKKVPSIVCTQPRIITAQDNVRVMTEWNNHLRIGENIGWSTKSHKILPTKPGILSATVGTLLAQLKTWDDDAILARYRFILIDEVHERSTEVDLVLLLLKNLIARRGAEVECPFVVLMSATIDPDIYLRYFNLSAGVANTIWCVGATATIDDMIVNEGRIVTRYIQEAADVVEKIVLEEPAGGPRSDILIFLPGKAEFKALAKLLAELNRKFVAANIAPIAVLTIDRDAVVTRSYNYNAALGNIPLYDMRETVDGKSIRVSRRCILSTNVAETGLTLDNLKYCIDSGYNREREYNPIFGFSALLTKPISKSRATQRRGRVGRKFPGVFYPLYPSFIHDMMSTQQFPAMITGNIGPIYIDIIASGDLPFDQYNTGLIEPPTPDATAEVLEKLWLLGFISERPTRFDTTVAQSVRAEPIAVASGKFGLSRLGVIARIFTGIDPCIIRMILAAYTWRVAVGDIVSIAAWLKMSTRDFGRDVEWRKIYQAGLPYYVGLNNIVTKIDILLMDEFIRGAILFNALSANCKSRRIMRDFCDANGLAYHGCLEFIRERDDIIVQMLEGGLVVFNFTTIMNTSEEMFIDALTKIKHCIYDGFRTNMMVAENGSYSVRGNVIARPAILYQQKIDRIILPKWVLYNELNFNENDGIISADRICTLDGFVSVDAHYDA